MGHPNDRSPPFPAIPVAVEATGRTPHTSQDSPHPLGDRYHDIRVSDTQHGSPTPNGSSSTPSRPHWPFINSDHAGDGTPGPKSAPRLGSQTSGGPHADPVKAGPRHSLDQVRKRGPRRCAVCQLMNCPGNGNRYEDFPLDHTLPSFFVHCS